MNCPRCSHEMISSSSDWLCLNCGNLQPKNSEVAASAATSGKADSAPINVAQAKSSPVEPTNPAEPKTASIDPAPAQVPSAKPENQEPKVVPQARPLFPASTQATVVPKPAPARPKPFSQSTPQTADTVPTPVSLAATPTVPQPSPESTPQATPIPAQPTPNLVMPQTDSPKPRMKKKLLWGGIVFAVLLLVGVIIGKLYWYDPLTAPISYMSKLMVTKTGDAKASLSYRADDSGTFGESVTLSANGVFDVSDLDAAKYDVEMALSAEEMKIKGRLMGAADTAYVKLSDVGIFEIFGVKADQWYKYPINETDKENATKCENQDVTDYLGSTKPTDIPVTQARRVGWMETIAGHKTVHYTGKVDFKKLQKAIDEANKGLSADCRIEFEEGDYKTLDVTYDLWTSKSFDRLVVKVIDTGQQKSTTSVTIDSSSYNKKVNITPPKDAINFEDLDPFAGSASGEEFNFEEPAPPTNFQ